MIADVIGAVLPYVVGFVAVAWLIGGLRDGY